MFTVLLVFGVLLLFCVVSPIYCSLLNVVPLNLRTFAISCMYLAIHLLGNFPAPVVTGAISDKFGNGCPDLKTNTTCLANPGQECVWIPAHKLDNAYCANMYQLRNALSIVFALLVFAILPWAVLSHRLKKRL